MWWLWVLGVALGGRGLPIESISFTVDVTGPIAVVVLQQEFVNDTADPVDATYVLPLDGGATVEALHIDAGGRIISGEWRERRWATNDVSRNLAKGIDPGLVTEHRTDQFRQQVRGVPTGARITVRTRIVQQLAWSDGGYSLTLPLRRAPRLVRGPMDAASPGPTAAPRSLRAAIDVDVGSAVPLRDVMSPSHDATVTPVGPSTRVSARPRLGRDFELRIDVDTSRTTAGAVVQAGHVLITIVPSDMPEESQVLPRELYVVRDRTISMHGAPGRRATAATRSIARRLRPDDRVRTIQRWPLPTIGPEWAPHQRGKIRRAWRPQPVTDTHSLGSFFQALHNPRDPERLRYIVVLSDGLLDGGRWLGGRGADPGTHVFAFGVDAHEHRWVLDELTRANGGSTTWVRDSRSASRARRRFVESFDRPILTDIGVDWKDWEVDLEPRHAQTLHVGRPVYLVGRVSRRGTGVPSLRGRDGEGTVQPDMPVVLQPTGDGLATMAATIRLQTLQTRARVRQTPQSVQEVVDAALTAGVPSDYTVLRAVDAATKVPGASTGVPGPEPRAVYILARDNKSYMRTGGCYGSPSYLPCRCLDSVLDTVESVPGAPSLRVNASTQRRLDSWAGATVPGTSVPPGPFDLQHHDGLRTEVGIRQHVGPTSGATFTDVRAMASGPVASADVWGLAEAAGTRTQVEDRRYVGHQGYARVSMQRGPEIRATLVAAQQGAQIRAGASATTQRISEGDARLQWFATQDTVVASHATAEEVRFGATTRTRWHARGRLSTQIDALGRHSLAAAADVEHVRWRIGADAPTVFDPDRPKATEHTRVGWALEDAWSALRGLRIVAGIRGEMAFSRPHLSPRLLAVVGQKGSRRARVVVGFGRRFGHLRLPHLRWTADRGLSRLHEALVELEGNTGTGVDVGIHSSYRRWRELPTVAGRIRRDTLVTTVFAEAALPWSRRAHIAYTDVRLLDNQPGIVIDDGSVARFRRTLTAQLMLELPIRYSRLTLEAQWFDQPIGLVAPDPATAGIPNVAGWEARTSYTLREPLRRGQLDVNVDVSWRGFDADRRGAIDLIGVAPSELPTEAFGGPRVGLGVAFHL